MDNTPPQPLPYALPAYLHDRDASHLNLLAIFHYILGALIILVSSVFILYIVLGGMMASGTLPASTPSRPPPPPAVGWFMVGFGTFAVVAGWGCGILTIYSGRCLKARRYWTFSFVIACILCLSAPLGTVLGIFTIVILMRDSVKSLYGVRSF